MKKKMPIEIQPEPEILSSRLTSTDEPFESSVLREVAFMPSIGEVISVRSAKAHLSGLLDLVARGREVVITSDGKPKARLVPAEVTSKRKPFGFSKGFVPAPWRGGPTADEIIREDRDSRGW